MRFTVNRLRQLRRKSKLNSDNYVVNYDKYGRAVINVGAEDFEDLFSTFCLYDLDVPEPDLITYLDTRNQYIPNKYDLHIAMHIKNPDYPKQKKIESTIKQTYENRLHNLHRKVRNMYFLSAIMMLLGLTFIGVEVLLNNLYNLPNYLSLLIQIFAWVFVWSSVDIFVFDRGELKLERLLTYRILTAHFSVQEFEPDAIKGKKKKQ